MTKSEMLMEIVKQTIPVLKQVCIDTMEGERYVFVLSIATKETFQIFCSDPALETAAMVLRDASEQLAEQLELELDAPRH